MKQEYAGAARTTRSTSRSTRSSRRSTPASRKGVAATAGRRRRCCRSSSDSDVMLRAHRRTSTPTPRRGPGSTATPDPWGMVVNPNYKGIELPPTRGRCSTRFEPPQLYASGTNDCLHEQPGAVPAAGRRADVAAARHHAGAAVRHRELQTVSASRSPRAAATGEKLVAARPADAGLPVHARRHVARPTPRATSSTPRRCRRSVAPGAGTTFTSTAGRTFVAPTRRLAAGRGGAAEARTDAPGPGRCRTPALRTPRPAAYPGTMLVYARGADRAACRPRRQGLRRRCSGSRRPPGRAPARATGSCRPGYLPLTAAERARCAGDLHDEGGDRR